MAALQQLDIFATHQPGANYGWLGTVEDFLKLPVERWLEQMRSQHQHLYQQQPAQNQVQAWQDSADVLSQALTEAYQQNWGLIFEYELPREGGRRPDVVLLTDASVWVLEFKQKSAIAAADCDQTIAYANDLESYHPGCRDRAVTPLLVLTKREKPADSQSGLRPVGPTQLKEVLAAETDADNIDPQAWAAANYEPLPTVIQAARQIFQHETLPSIRRAESAGIPQLLETLNQIVGQASEQKERHLVLITGVPGAGKTLVGLQFVYQNPLAESDSPQAVFLSGNGPLIQVLQYALKNKVFVQPVRNFYLQHQVRHQSAPPEHMIVFDEAQRAWDAGRMNEKYGIEQAAGGAVLRIAGRIPDWSVVVALIGEGQEIHVGEEEEIDQWQVGLTQSEERWQVHCPRRYEAVFAEVSDKLHADPQFDLTHSLRTHRAEAVQDWINLLLLGNADAAAALVPELWDSGFRAYLTRDLDVAKQYCRDRYANQPDKRYGIVASSRARNLPNYGVANDYKSTLRVKAGPWYIDPVDSPRSCCALDQVVTEFGCQGLELDMAIAAWGSDLVWQDGDWVCTTRQRQVQDPRRLRLNSYRVLLSRGRDGFVVFVPPEARMDSTAEMLMSAGVVAL